LGQMTGRDAAGEFDGVERALLYGVWLTALAGMVGSLFFSEVMGYPPCVLCWYQRIALYPLVVIVAVGLATADRRVALYSLPFTIIGLIIAGYHNLLYYGIVPEDITPCSEGVPCNAKQLELFGFITIPLMAFMGFAAATVLLLIFRSRNAKIQ
jgi:disulfide bond formation protein DsbB